MRCVGCFGADTPRGNTRLLADGDWALATSSDTRSNDDASLTGTLSMSTDPAEIDELWNPFAGAYFVSV